MSSRASELPVVIAVANMDLYPYDLPHRANWGSNLEELAPYLQETGCHDFEVHPTDRIVQDTTDRQQCGDTQLLDLIVGSLHQTFNNGDDLLGRIADRRGVLRSAPSIPAMDIIQTALSRPVPAVYYPESPGYAATRDEQSRHFRGFRIAQPAAELYRKRGIRNEQELLPSLARIGIAGLCPDTVHARRKAADGTSPPPITQVWSEQFASGRVFQMHVSADRFDMGARDPELGRKSVQEYQAFTSRHWQNARDTEMGEMITAAIENWVPPDELVHAVGKPVLRQVIEVPPRPRAILRRVAEHARFVENLAEVIREAGARPVLWGDAA